MATIKAYETAHGTRYRVRYTKPDGTYTDKRGFKRKKDADDFIANFTVAKNNGEYIDPQRSKVTVSDRGTVWLEGKRVLAPSTYVAYDFAWNVHVKPRWGKYALSAVDHSEVQEWISSLSTTRSPTTVRRAYDTLAGIFDAAVRDGRIKKNPVRGVALPRKVRGEHHYLTVAQVESLADSCADQWQSELVLSLVYTAARFSEMAAVRVGKVSLRPRQILLDRNAPLVRGYIVEGDLKDHEVRTIPYPAFLSPILAARMKNRGHDDLLFAAPQGGFLRTPTVIQNSWYDKAKEKAGIDPAVTIHDLRHTGVSLAVKAGANIKVIQHMCGHAKASMTLDIYADLFPEDLDSVAVSLDALRSEEISGKNRANEKKKAPEPSG